MIDILGHPITVGATVLTNGYYTACMNTITTVEKITKKAVYAKVDAVWYDWETKQRHRTKKLMRRRPDQFIVIDKQLKYNQKTYPENML
jgi:allantoicase